MSEDTKKSALRAGTTPPGRVVRDKRGHTVWQWTEEEQSTGSTSVLLRFLDNDALSLEPTQAVPIPSGMRPAVSGGVATESTSVELRRLDNGQLGIEPTWSVPIPDRLRRKRPRTSKPDNDGDDAAEDAERSEGEQAGGGFNPYDHS